MGVSMAGEWNFLMVNGKGIARKEFWENIKQALNEIPEDARESAQIRTSQLTPASSMSASALLTTEAAIFYFVPEKEPVPFFAVEDGDPEFLPEPWKAPGQ